MKYVTRSPTTSSSELGGACGWLVAGDGEVRVFIWENGTNMPQSGWQEKKDLYLWLPLDVPLPMCWPCGIKQKDSRRLIAEALLYKIDKSMILEIKNAQST